MTGLEDILARLAAGQQHTDAETERLRAEIEQLTLRLRELEQHAEHLQITRKTLLGMAHESGPATTQPEPATQGLPDNPAYQHILTVLSEAAGPLRARDLCDALDLGFEPNAIESMRAKLKRLVKHGLAEEKEPGLFTLARRQHE